MLKISNVQISEKNKNDKASFRFFIWPDELKLVTEVPVQIEGTADESWLTVTMFAKEARVTPQAVRKMISENRLPARKVGAQHLILREDLNFYMSKK